MLLLCNIFILIQISLFTEQVETSSVVKHLLCCHALCLKIQDILIRIIRIIITLRPYSDLFVSHLAVPLFDKLLSTLCYHNTCLFLQCSFIQYPFNSLS